MTVQGRLRRLIESGSTEEIFAEAAAQGMATLRQDGFRLALAGISSLDEIRRVTGDRLLSFASFASRGKPCFPRGPPFFLCSRPDLSLLRRTSSAPRRKS